MAGPSSDFRHNVSSRANHMHIVNLLNNPNDEGPPHKCQRIGGGFASKDAIATFQTLDVARYPSLLGPPNGSDTTSIKSLLNATEPETSSPSPGEKRSGYPPVSKIACEVCGEGFTCDSLLRKHQAKHTKPFKCKQKGCERTVSGFTSPNDLKRHENSVHKGTKGPAIGFNCIYDQCRDRNKIYFRLDNFRNHLKKLHSTTDPRRMSAFLKMAESECRVEVNPEDANQELASEANSPSARSRKGSGPVSFSQKKSKKLQWVVTKVDNGNLHRPRPAYYGPLEEDSSDSAMDMDRSDMEGTPGSTVAPTSPGFQNQDQTSPRQQYHHRQWSPVVPQETEDALTRKKRIVDIQSQIHEMRVKLDGLQSELSRLEANEAQTGGPQATLGSQAASNGYALGVEGSRANGTPLRPLGFSTSIDRFDPPTEVPGPQYHPVGGVRTTVIAAERNNKRGPETSASALSSPETLVDSLYDDHHPGTTGLNARESRNPSTSVVSYSPPIPPQQKANLPPGGAPEVRAPPEKPHRCDEVGCKSSFARMSEWKKHMKRHKKPFGCTARYCHKHFGSKSDWRRHENSQHHRLESWKCRLPIAPYGPGDICTAMHFRKENFVNHLKSSAHGIKEEAKIKEHAEKYYIGGSNHHIFWCGFCHDETGRQGKIINLKNKGLPGWDERFDHLGNHFSSGASIADYKYQDEPIISEDPTSSDTEGEEPNTQAPADWQLQQLAQASVMHSTSNAAAAVPSGQTAVTRVNARGGSGRSKQQNWAWFCCKCISTRNVSHPFLVDLQLSCLDCEHHRCGTCRMQILDEDQTEAAKSVDRRKKPRKGA